VNRKYGIWIEYLYRSVVLYEGEWGILESIACDTDTHVMYVMCVYIRVHSRPSPVKEGLHAQLNEPCKLLQLAFSSLQSSVCSLHSSTSAMRYKHITSSLIVVIGVDLAGLLGRRMARAEGGSVLSGVAYGEGCPLSSRLRGLGERRKLPQRGPGRIVGQNTPRKRILAYFEGHRTLIFVPIWQNLGGGNLY